MAFNCSICGEESTRICVWCTKDTCGNHLCDKCGRCSDCCECEVPLDGPPVPPPTVHELAPAAAFIMQEAEPPREEPPVPGEPAPPVHEPTPMPGEPDPPVREPDPMPGEPEPPIGEPEPLSAAAPETEIAG